MPTCRREEVRAFFIRLSLWLSSPRLWLTPLALQRVLGPAVALKREKLVQLRRFSHLTVMRPLPHLLMLLVAN